MMNDCAVIFHSGVFVLFFSFSWTFCNFRSFNSVQLGKVFYLKINKNGGKVSKSAAVVVFFSVCYILSYNETTGKKSPY